MPGDLRDPESTNPFYYDSRYEEPKNPFEAGAPDTDKYLQSIAIEQTGSRLNQEKMEALKQILNEKGFFHRNIGDQSFIDEVKKQVNVLKMARRIINARIK